MAHGQLRVVRQHRADPDGDRIVRGSQQVHRTLRPRAGDPSRTAGCIGDRAIERHGQLQRYERSIQLEPGEKVCDQLPGPRLLDADIHPKVGLPQPLDPPTRHGVRIAQRDHHARQSRGDHGIGTRRRPSHVRARLQRDVHRGTARTLACRAQRRDLGVITAVFGVKALPHQFAIANDHRADHRIGRRAPEPTSGKRERASHEGAIRAAGAAPVDHGIRSRSAAPPFRTAAVRRRAA